MKPPAFEYHRPDSLDEACTLLSTLDNAKVLAGGQSLIAMLNMRFVFPDHLVDLNHTADLSYVRESDGRIHIGAMTRQRELEQSSLLRERCPLMAEAIAQVGHRQTRNRGTIGGSLCHLDPSAELPMVAMALDASLSAQSVRGTRTIAMADFPAFYMTPAIEADEIVTAVDFEPWPAGHGHAFVEYARRHGDFAMVAAAALVERSGDNNIRRAAVVVGGVGSGPIRCTEAESILIGSAGDADAIAKASATCAGIEAMEDVHATSAYRQHLAEVLSGRALTSACARATAN